MIDDEDFVAGPEAFESTSKVACVVVGVQEGGDGRHGRSDIRT
jgi:hypothetical protein